MFRKYVNIIGVILTATITNIAAANTLQAVVANVTATGTYSSGAIFVLFDRAISSCSGDGRIDLGANHPAKTQMLSIAMTAFASGKAVVIHPGSCNGSTPIFGDVGDSYFFLTNEKPQ